MLRKLMQLGYKNNCSMTNVLPLFEIHVCSVQMQAYSWGHSVSLTHFLVSIVFEFHV